MIGTEEDVRRELGSATRLGGLLVVCSLLFVTTSRTEKQGKLSTVITGQVRSVGDVFPLVDCRSRDVENSSVHGLSRQQKLEDYVSGERVASSTGKVLCRRALVGVFVEPDNEGGLEEPTEEKMVRDIRVPI